VEKVIIIIIIIILLIRSHSLHFFTVELCDRQ